MSDLSAVAPDGADGNPGAARATGREPLPSQATAEDSVRRPAGALEAEVLRVLLDAGRPLTATETGERLTGPLAYSTVVTILTRLHDKRVLARTRVGRAYAYAPVVDQSGLAARRMHQVLSRETDRAAVLAHFVSDLTHGDEELLRRLLDDTERPRRP